MQLLKLVVRQPELSKLIAPLLWKRLPQLSLEEEEVMTIAEIQLAELSETRAYQNILAKGREEGLEMGGQREAGCWCSSSCGVDSAACRPSKALLAFGSPVDLRAWLVNRRGD